jgi:predicted dehydrogenase
MSGADVEDHAAVQLELANGVAVQLACSWRISAGRDCAIEASFYGTDGGVAMRNEGGSFFDFTAERFAGTRSERIAAPPDDWGGRAIAEWVARLDDGARFDPEAERFVTVTEVLDRIYREGQIEPPRGAGPRPEAEPSPEGRGPGAPRRRGDR